MLDLKPPVVVMSPLWSTATRVQDYGLQNSEYQRGGYLWHGQGNLNLPLAAG